MFHWGTVVGTNLEHDTESTGTSAPKHPILDCRLAKGKGLFLKTLVTLKFRIQVTQPNTACHNTRVLTQSAREGKLEEAAGHHEGTTKSTPKSTRRCARNQHVRIYFLPPLAIRVGFGVAAGVAGLSGVYNQLHKALVLMTAGQVMHVHVPSQGTDAL